MKANTSPALPGEVQGYVQLQRQVHEALLKERPEWIEPTGKCPMCEIYESRLAELLGLASSSDYRSAARLNTALESLAQGVPQLAIPITYDQPGVAARIAHHKTGVVTSIDKLTADHNALLLEEVLTNPTYRENARRLQRAIVEANGLSVAADLIEESLAVREKVRVPAG